MYCDSLVHTRRNECPEFQEALAKGAVGINEMGRVKLMATGEELPLMFGRGGMKVVVQNKLARGAPSGGAGGSAAGVVGSSYGISGKDFDDEFMRPWEVRCSMVVGKGQGGHQ
jgi:hypothetical protein